jgi:hypothetical protein
MSTALVIPDLRTSNLPVGWAEDYVMRGVIDAPWDDLDEYEAILRARASYIESLEKGDAVELEKALRIIEARRGELLDHTVVPGGRPNLPTRGEVEVTSQTASRYRKIARHWQSIWPEIARSTDRREVTQAAVLRMIERIEAAAKPERPPEKPTPKAVPKLQAHQPEPDPEHEGWGETDLLSEFEKLVEESAKKDELLDHLTKDDQVRENSALLARIAGLEARIGQLTTTAREAQNMAEANSKVLRALRDEYQVERNSQILELSREQRRRLKEQDKVLAHLREILWVQSDPEIIHKVEELLR